MADDNNLLGPAQGPFSNIIQSGLVPGVSNAPDMRPSGYMGASGKLAFMGTKLIEGIQKGKMLAYMKQEAQKDQTFKAGLAQIQSQLSDPNLTPEQRSRLTTLQGQWFAQHLQPELDGGKKGKGKKGEGTPGDHIKGMLGSIVGKLGGPDMPKSGTNQVEWLKAQLHDIGAPSLSDNLRTYQSVIHAAIVDNPDMPREKIEQLKSVQGATAEMSRMVGPEKANVYKEQALAGSSSQMQKLQVEEKQTLVEEEKSALETAKRLDSITGQDAAPPPSRTMDERAYTPANYTPAAGADQGPPVMQPTPEAKKTPVERASDRYTTGDTAHLFGKQVAVPPEYYKRYGQPRTVYVTKGTETMALVSPRDGVLLEPGTGRVFNYKQAQSEGYQFDSARPVRINPPVPDYKMGVDPSGKHMIWYQVDRASGKPVPVLQADGKTYLQAHLDKTATDQTLKAFRIADDVTKRRDAEDLRLKAAYDRDVLDITNSSGVKYSTLTDPAKKKEALAQRERDFQTSVSVNHAMADSRLKIIGHSLGVDNMINTMVDQQPAPSSESKFDFAPGTAGAEWNKDN